MCAVSTTAIRTMAPPPTAPSKKRRTFSRPERHDICSAIRNHSESKKIQRLLDNWLYSMTEVSPVVASVADKPPLVKGFGELVAIEWILMGESGWLGGFSFFLESLSILSIHHMTFPRGHENIAPVSSCSRAASTPKIHKYAVTQAPIRGSAWWRISRSASGSAACP